MPEEKTAYRRLPGRTVGLISSCTLHLAEDHLLYAEQPWFYQAYTRFYFRDIQSIVISDSTAFVGMNIFLGGVFTLSTVLALLFFSNIPPLSYFIGVVALTFLILFIINLAKGPTCKFAIQTRVNRKHIASLSRKRTAYRALPIIEQYIRAQQDARSQGELIDAAWRDSMRSADTSSPGSLDPDEREPNDPPGDDAV